MFEQNGFEQLIMAISSIRKRILPGQGGLWEVAHADDVRPRLDFEIAQLALQAPQLLRVVLGLEPQRQQL